MRVYVCVEQQSSAETHTGAVDERRKKIERGGVEKEFFPDGL